MDNIELSGWTVIISIVLFIFSFYFVLTFIENLHKGDERITKQSKFAAIICLSTALFTPVLTSLLF